MMPSSGHYGMDASPQQPWWKAHENGAVESQNPASQESH